MSPKYDALRWKILRREALEDHRIFTLSQYQVEHPHSKQVLPWVVLDCPDWCNVIALTPADDVVLIRQYRPGPDAVTLEIPGGMVDPGEDALDAAKRELREETGYTAPRWIELGMVEPNPAFQTNRCRSFLAIDATKEEELELDAGEWILTELHPLATIAGLIDRQEITHALVVTAFYHFLREAGGWQRPEA